MNFDFTVLAMEKNGFCANFSFFFAVAFFLTEDFFLGFLTDFFETTTRVLPDLTGTSGISISILITRLLTRID